MQISSESVDDLLVMRIQGRLDNDGAGDLTAAIEEAVRLGSHAIAVDLAEIKYISSAGIGALVRAHKQLQAIRGRFALVAASPEVRNVIRLTGLSQILVIQDHTPSLATTSITIQSAPGVSYRDGMMYELYNLRSESRLSCDVIGHPASLIDDAYSASQCRAIEFPAASIGLGLGAFGQDFDDCAQRFGEFLSAGGMTAQQPTSETKKPDFERVIGEFVPRVQMLYGLRCRGEFPQLIRFDPEEDQSRVPLSALAEQVLTLTGSQLSAIVCLAESSGLIGARLRRSPAAAVTSGATSHPTAVGSQRETRFSHPEIRRWLSFTPDRAYAHSLALVVGIVSRGEPSGTAKPLARLLRPLAPGLDLWGHFHAATFSYRPFKKRRLDLEETVAALCESEDLQAVLHLLHDDREITGGGESEFVRGACWTGPIADVIEQGT